MYRDLPLENVDHLSSTLVDDSKHIGGTIQEFACTRYDVQCYWGITDSGVICCLEWESKKLDIEVSRLVKVAM